jgi:hypothetical protein
VVQVEAAIPASLKNALQSLPCSQVVAAPVLLPCPALQVQVQVVVTACSMTARLGKLRAPSVSSAFAAQSTQPGTRFTRPVRRTLGATSGGDQPGWRGARAGCRTVQQPVTTKPERALIMTMEC